MDIEACERLDIDIDKLTKGAIIGYAFLYHVKEYKNQDEFNKDKQKHFSILLLVDILMDTNMVS